MGADTFEQRGRGKTAKEAFHSAVEEAAYEYGHGGYTGSLAEKVKFVMVGQPLPSKEAHALADKMISDGDFAIDDKWGPAGCIEIALEKPREDGLREFLFFGWASS